MLQGSDHPLVSTATGRVEDDASIKHALGCTVGTLGLLLKAKEAGLIATIRPELDTLLETSFFLGEQLYDQLLQRAGEHRNK